MRENCVPERKKDRNVSDSRRRQPDGTLEECAGAYVTSDNQKCGVGIANENRREDGRRVEKRQTNGCRVSLVQRRRNKYDPTYDGGAGGGTLWEKGVLGVVWKRRKQ